MISKVCAACTNFYVVEARADYSDVTPGNEFEMHCTKAHWYFDAQNVTAADLLKIMAAGSDCPDFQVKP